MTTAPPLYSIDLLAPHQRYLLKSGREVTGASTIAKLTSNYEVLMRWHNKQGRAGINTSITVPQAADIGTICHAMIEGWLRGMQLDRANLDPDLCQQAEYGFDRFRRWWDQAGLQPIHLERQMVSEEHEFGGTEDIHAINRVHELTVLADIKTGMGVYDNYKVQAFGYDILAEETDGRAPDMVKIIRVGKKEKGDIEVVDITDEREHWRKVFLAAKDLNNALKGEWR